MPEPADESPGRALLVALGAMLGVALLVGLAVGAVVLTLTGLGSGDDGASGPRGGSSEESLFMPDYTPTESAGEEWQLPRVREPQTPDVELPEGEPSTPEGAGTITLFVAPQSVPAGGRINFNGVYDGAEGATLQVQRRENGAWTDFPVTATVRGGSFETWIQTSRTGRTEFRVYDAAADEGSNPVAVEIG
jgi:hypothetical protein